MKKIIIILVVLVFCSCQIPTMPEQQTGGKTCDTTARDTKERDTTWFY